MTAWLAGALGGALGALLAVGSLYLLRRRDYGALAALWVSIGTLVALVLVIVLTTWDTPALG